MTFQQVLWAIDEVAQMAAESSFDAHGEAVAPEMAWELIIDMLGSTDDKRLSLLPDSMPRQFVHDYKRHCRVIQEKRAIA